jgi:ferritin-like metal-binding protein YciE
MAHEDLFMAWLNDAYGMENALVQVLQNHVKDAKDHPQMQAKIQEHLDKTRQHAELVKGCIERRAGSTSALKTGMSNLMGVMQGMSTGAAEDELVKNGIADYAAENFEIASYNALITAAQDLGDTQTASVCQQILGDEQDMANWLAQHLPEAVDEIIKKKAAAHA